MADDPATVTTEADVAGTTVEAITPSGQRSSAARAAITIRRIVLAILGLARRVPARPIATTPELVAPIPDVRRPIGSDKMCQGCRQRHPTSVVAAWLVPLVGSRRGDAFVLKFDYTVVGSGTRDDLRIDAPGVAKAHVRIIQQSHGFALQNGSESLETFVDGQRVKGYTQLKDGQIISVAGAQLAFKYVLEQAGDVYARGHRL